ncbi:MAG: hypothetical protein ACI8WB_001613 [Phenylobacterium sp.]|jgi:hypothetical protein
MKFGQRSLIISTLLLTTIASTIIGTAATASALRCGTKLASEGDSQYKFFKLCGEPDFVETKVVYLTKSASKKYPDISGYHIHDAQGEKGFGGHRPTKTKVINSDVIISHEQEQQVEIEKWTYDFGRRKLIRKVRFIDGVAVEITTHGYGLSSQ